MKYIIIIAAFAFAIESCGDSSTESSVTRVNGKAVKRNTQITKENAYNNLFLDSAGIEKFIVEQKLNDTISNHIRDFYNARNFEFAWFDSKGLNEQALAFRNLYDYNKDSATDRKKLDYRLDRLAGAENPSASESNADIINSELMLTWRFINYATDEYKNPKVIAAASTHFTPTSRT